MAALVLDLHLASTHRTAFRAAAPGALKQDRNMALPTGAIEIHSQWGARLLVILIAAAVIGGMCFIPAETWHAMLRN